MTEGGLITSLEYEAIRRMQAAWTNPKHKPPLRSNDEETWRLWWLNEARQYCRTTDPVCHAEDYLSLVEQAAVNILFAASALREAIENGKSERAAALGILLICEAISGGYSLEFDALKFTREAISKAKKRRVEKSIGVKHKDFGKARELCVWKAKAMWKDQPSMRIGKVAEACRQSMLDSIQAFSSLTVRDVPEVVTIKKWLGAASKSRKLSIPPEAQKRGRPSAN